MSVRSNPREHFRLTKISSSKFSQSEAASGGFEARRCKDEQDEGFAVSFQQAERGRMFSHVIRRAGRIREKAWSKPVQVHTTGMKILLFF